MKVRRSLRATLKNVSQEKVIQITPKKACINDL